MTQTTTSLSKLTKNMMIVDLMQTMGWTRDRALAAIEELEENRLIQISDNGSLKLQMLGGV